MNHHILSFLLLLLLSVQPLSAQRTPADYVNPFIGGSATGHTFPGACLPFGMVQPGPVTGHIGWRYCAGYVYADSLMSGFSQTRLNGTGCLDLSDVLLMPVTGGTRRTDYRSRFSKTSERATPGYYSVYLDEPAVRAELTATPHVAFHRYTFSRADSAALYVDLQHGPAWNESLYARRVCHSSIRQDDSCTLSGHLQTKVWAKRDVFFVIRFSRPLSSLQELPSAAGERGARRLVRFDLRSGDTLGVKIALSTTSVEGARRNLNNELAGWDFNAVRDHARRVWNNRLSVLQASGTDEEKTNFYTALYHTLIQPNNIADIDGAYRNYRNEISYSPDSTFYSTFSTWDTYRAAHPLYTLTALDRVAPFVRSLLDQAEVCGHLPVWPLWGKETYCMIGNHAVSIVAEAAAKGFTGFDTARAWRAVRRSLTEARAAKNRWDIYDRYGYYPADSIRSESVSLTLETSYDDYAAASLAKQFGHWDDARFFAQRARAWRNLFDPDTRFMRPRLSNGSWKPGFDPLAVSHAESWGGDYTEGNAWQYRWHVQHDVPGLIRLMGGGKAFCQRLDSLFIQPQSQRQLADLTGAIGQYIHGNEPSHHVPYLYALAGHPARTHELVRHIVTTLYRPTPDGLCGNDDCGQMSAWYIFSCMGFYPVDPVSATYVLGAPQLPRCSVSLPGGKTFTVIADHLSRRNCYVGAVYLNGKPYRETFLRHADILQGGTLRFVMTSRPPHPSFVP